jgi:hypothetical protein
MLKKMTVYADGKSRGAWLGSRRAARPRWQERVAAAIPNGWDEVPRIGF